MQLKVVQHLYEEHKPRALYSLHKISKELDLDLRKLWATIYYWDDRGLLESCSFLSSWGIHFTPSMELFREYDLPIDVIGTDEIDPEFSDLRFIKGLREIDMGGYGTIYAWFNTELARMEAIKILHEDQGIGYEALLKEARRLSKLKHRNILNIYDIAVTIDPKTGTQQPCMRLELIDGTTLLDELSTEPKPNLESRVKWLSQILSALQYANSEGVYHADLHSSNILISKNGDAILIDFGGERSSSFLATRKDEYQTSGLNGIFVETLHGMVPDKEISDIRKGFNSLKEYKKIVDSINRQES